MICHLRSFRLVRGLSQSDLGELVGVRRQAIYDLEAGRYLPNTALALRLAKVLGCTVEDLFCLEEVDRDHPVSVAGPAVPPGSRVSLAKVRGHLIAYGLEGKRMLTDGLQAADGLMQPGGVLLLQEEKYLDQKALLLGCDPAFAILEAHISRKAPDVRLQCRFASSLKALLELSAGHTHVAATHLHNTGPGEANLQMARQILTDSPLSLLLFPISKKA